MVGQFCSYCGSLISPATGKCKVCGRTAGEGRPDITKIIQSPRILPPGETATPFFPYRPRNCQLDMIRDMLSTLDDGRHIVVESGTGTGKTVVSLAAALEHTRKHGKKLVYLTRTISQSDQVMKELAAINTINPVSGVTVTGRSRSCPLLRSMTGYEELHPSVISNLCEERKKKTGSNGCRFYEHTKIRTEETERYCRTNLPTSEQLDRYCEENEICPYESKKALMKAVDVVVAPYVHILSEDIRTNFLGNMMADEKNIVVIVDEAHNIIDAAREQESFSISMRLIDSAIDETTTLRDPSVFDEIKIKPFIEQFKAIVRGTANEKLSMTRKEAVVEYGSIESRMMQRFSMSGSQLLSAVDIMIELGQGRTELLMEKGDNRISDIFTLGTAMKNWMNSDPDSFIRSIKADEDGEYLHAACIDPNDVTGFLRSIKGVIHMSGTLQPLDQYSRVMNLPDDTVDRIYPSSFPPENRSVIYLNNVTTRYEDMQRDPSIFSRMEKNIAKLCNAVEKNTLVFFPSYSMMSKMRPFLERDVRKNAYWEESRQQKKTMSALNRFRNGRDGVFFTVMGGSIAEGIDFPGDELSFAIIVGIPYPPPTMEIKAMSQMFDRKYGPGTGWRYTSEVPALRKMKQAIGRLIRTETDRGMAVIFDSRISKYSVQLDARLSTDPLKDVTEFFEHTDG